MTPTHHALDRVANRLSHGGILDMQSRRAQLATEELGEMLHDFQIPVKGTATSAVVWATVELEFDVDFADAPEQRDSPYVEPTMTFGAKLDNPVMVTAVVTMYVHDTDRNAIIGAHVAVGVLASEPTTYEGRVFVCFQGYGAPSENAAALDVGT